MPRHLPVLGAAVDKYAVASSDVPCAENLHLCKAICCSLVVHLSQQDLDEGVVAWDEDRPYWIRHAGGKCVHLAAEGCSIYAQRPAQCRSFDCRKDTRIWQDYERRIPNRNLERLAVISANARARPPIGDD